MNFREYLLNTIHRRWNCGQLVFNEFAGSCCGCRTHLSGICAQNWTRVYEESQAMGSETHYGTVQCLSGVLFHMDVSHGEHTPRILDPIT